MTEFLVIPMLVAAAVMLYCRRCMPADEFPFAGLFTFVIGCVVAAGVFLAMLLFVGLQVLLRFLPL